MSDSSSSASGPVDEIWSKKSDSFFRIVPFYPLYMNVMELIMNVDNMLVFLPSIMFNRCLNSSGYQFGIKEEHNLNPRCYPEQFKDAQYGERVHSAENFKLVFI